MCWHSLPEVIAYCFAHPAGCDITMNRMGVRSLGSLHSRVFTHSIETFLSDPEGLAKCQCADPCIESQYSASVTNYKFPSKNGIKYQNISNLGKSREVAKGSLQQFLLYWTKSYGMCKAFPSQHCYQQLSIYCVKYLQISQRKLRFWH